MTSKSVTVEEAMAQYEKAMQEAEECEIRSMMLLLLRQAKKRFGPAPSETESQLYSIEDAPRLERLADSIFTAKSWQEWLATP